MTDTQSIFSPDKKSVAHLTYFGNLAIGLSSELNAILPIQYKYVNGSTIQIKPGEKQIKGHLIKYPTGNLTEQYKYPTKSDDIKGNNLVFNKGLFHKFNFLVKNKVTKFPGQYVNYMNDASLKGSFVLEVKKNGYVLLYEKKQKMLFGKQILLMKEKVLIIYI